MMGREEQRHDLEVAMEPPSPHNFSFNSSSNDQLPPPSPSRRFPPPSPSRRFRRMDHQYSARLAVARSPKASSSSGSNASLYHSPSNRRGINSSSTRTLSAPRLNSFSLFDGGGTNADTISNIRTPERRGIGNLTVPNTPDSAGTAYSQVSDIENINVLDFSLDSPSRRRRTSGTLLSPRPFVAGGGAPLSDRFIPSRATSDLDVVLDQVGPFGPRTPGGGPDHNGESGDGGDNNAAEGAEGAGADGTGTGGGGAANHMSADGSGGTGNASRVIHNRIIQAELNNEGYYTTTTHHHHGFGTTTASPGPISTMHAYSSVSLFSGVGNGNPMSSGGRGGGRLTTSPGGGGSVFNFQSTRAVLSSKGTTPERRVDSVLRTFNCSPTASASTHSLMAGPAKNRRRVPKVPFKVLDAPALQDDFYLNLVDWSSLNVLAVGLGSCVYLWSAFTAKVTKLCDLAESEDIITSVSWTRRGTHLAVGTNSGMVQLWDTQKCQKVRSITGHVARVGTLAWNGSTLVSGSRDRLIYMRDVRAQQSVTTRLAGHKQEVCGLKWSFDEPAFLASGGNDNKLLIWDIKCTTKPLHKLSDHNAAVKAIAWSPHQHGLLASGGGTADRCIRFWNTINGTCLNCIDTGSQVCNLAWSKTTSQELVSTHGYSLNQIVIWRYPTMSKVATLTGHTYRVLYLSMSPDGSTIVTGAGDETLRFWQAFPGPRSSRSSGGNGTTMLLSSSPGSVVR